MTKMLTKIRKIFAIALALVMMFSLIPGEALFSKAEDSVIAITIDGNGGLLSYKADENATAQQISQFNIDSLKNGDKIGMVGPVKGNYFDGWEIIYWDNNSMQEVKIGDISADPGLTNGYTVDTSVLTGNTNNNYTFRAKWNKTSNVVISSAGGTWSEELSGGNTWPIFGDIVQNTVPGTKFTDIRNINIGSITKNNMTLQGWVLYTGKQAGPNGQGGYQLTYDNNDIPVLYTNLQNALQDFTPIEDKDYYICAKWDGEDYVKELDGGCRK